MFELLSNLNINFSTKDQVLEVLEKCNTLLLEGEVVKVDACIKIVVALLLCIMVYSFKPIEQQLTVVSQMFNI